MVKIVILAILGLLGFFILLAYSAGLYYHGEDPSWEHWKFWKWRCIVKKK